MFAKLLRDQLSAPLKQSLRDRIDSPAGAFSVVAQGRIDLIVEFVHGEFTLKTFTHIEVNQPASGIVNHNHVVVVVPTGQEFFGFLNPVIDQSQHRIVGL
ncbi:hypothetical protein WN67_32820 [Mycolicibacterium obuense]|uniref:Uncharacterized protein n=1 Tax=Mycolicibacterium obuense TaxID=1807 RepID=A0A0M2WCV4_9MYCO|nr:hypothetical protein WN67_32820 [Mycolicibacterium obuense]